MKLNLLNGLSIDSSHALYLSPGNEGDECCQSAPDYPFYICSREKGHTRLEGTEGDCAAHGGHGKGKIVMFARWNKDEIIADMNNQDDEGEKRFEEAMTNYEKPVEDELDDIGYTDDDGRPLGVV